VVIPDGGNHLMFSHKVAEPQGESKTDYDIFCLLAEKLGFLEAFSEGRTEEMWLEKFIAESEVPDPEEFKRKGIYFGADQYRVAFLSFVADPEANPLKTPSGKVQIYSEAYAGSGYSPVPSCRVAYPPASYPLRLVSPKSRFRVHSMGWNIPFLRERERHALWIHPSDAKARGITDGDEVNVSSPQGLLRIPAMVTEDIALGVVSILEGVWPTFDADGVETSGAVNVLTSTVPTQPSQGSRTHTVFVQVDACKPART
jgi:anaerobic dimethyl sulfoxide reductase subunit A